MRIGAATAFFPGGLRSLAPAIALLLMACGLTTMQVLDAKDTRALVPFLKDQMTKTAVMEELDRSRYAVLMWVDRSKGDSRPDAQVIADEPGGIAVYLVTFEERGLYELVLVFDDHNRLKRYSLFRVK